TPPQFEDLSGRIKTAFSFTQGVKKLPHRGFGRGGIGIDHASVLPKVRRPHSTDCLSCQMNAVPKSAKREVNKLQVLGCVPAADEEPDGGSGGGDGDGAQAGAAGVLRLDAWDGVRAPDAGGIRGADARAADQVAAEEGATAGVHADRKAGAVGK